MSPHHFFPHIEAAVINGDPAGPANVRRLQMCGEHARYVQESPSTCESVKALDAHLQTASPINLGKSTEGQRHVYTLPSPRVSPFLPFEREARSKPRDGDVEDPRVKRVGRLRSLKGQAGPGQAGMGRAGLGARGSRGPSAAAESFAGA